MSNRRFIYSSFVTELKQIDSAEEVGLDILYQFEVGDGCSRFQCFMLLLVSGATELWHYFPARYRLL